MPPENYKSFPSKKERESLMEQLKQLEDERDPLTSRDHYKNYVSSLKQLNEIMDHYYTPDAEGNVDTLEQDGKDKLMEAIIETATLGETFLADIANNGKNLNKGVPGIVSSVQSMMSQDYETLALYNPKNMELTLPEIQQDARTQVIDLRGVKIGKMGNAQSSRLPMTIVDEKGMKTSGVFTKASYVSVAGPFKKMIDEAANQCDNPEGKKQLQNFISGYRDYLQKKNKKLLGVEPKEAGDEMIVGKMIQQGMWEKKNIGDFMKRSGVDINNLSLNAKNILMENFDTFVKEPAYWVNGLELGLKDGDRLDQRNSAMSAVANLLGVSKLVARSTNMKYMDEDGNVIEGTFMEKAQGLDLVGKGNEALFEHVSDGLFQQGSDLNKDIADIQVLDYICGNIDRHEGNLFYDVDEKTGLIKGIQGIDNDSAFGLYSSGKNGRNFRLSGTDSLTVVSADMAKKISNISPEMLKFALRGRGLTDKEIQAACGRLIEVKEAVKEPLTKPFAKNIADIMQNKGNKTLSIMEPEDLKKVPPGTFGCEAGNLFRFVNDGINTAKSYARSNGYQYNPKKINEKQFREVSTTGRMFTAGGISESLKGMSRMIRNEVTGFVVSGLSKFMRSSDKFRKMVAAVKTADKLSAELKKEIGENGGLDRDDPKVSEQLKKADKAMEEVRKATKEYLEKKMKEKKVNSLDQLRGKNAYEQKRIDYAKKLMDNVKEYDMISHPESANAKQVRETVKNRIDLAAKRKARKNATNKTGPDASKKGKTM